MPEITATETKLIDLAVTILATELPRLIAFLCSLRSQGQRTAEQIVADLARANAIDAAVIAAARKALTEAGVSVDPG